MNGEHKGKKEYKRKNKEKNIIYKLLYTINKNVCNHFEKEQHKYIFNEMGNMENNHQ